MRRIVVGRRPGRRGDQRTVANQFGHSHLAIHTDLQSRGLRSGAQQRDLIDGQGMMDLPLIRLGLHRERVDHLFLCSGQPFFEAVLGILIHQEPDRAPVHPVDRRGQVLRAVQGGEHEPVTAQCHDHIRARFGVVTVAPRQARLRSLGKRGRAGGESDAQ